MTDKNFTQIKAILKEELKTVATKADLKPIREDISAIRRDTKQIVSFFDKEYLQLRKRIERLEEHLDLPPIQ